MKNFTLERELQIQQEAQREQAKQCCRCNFEFQKVCKRQTHCPRAQFTFKVR